MPTQPNASALDVIVLDFETSGLSPDYGDRAIEIGAIKLRDGKVVDQFQALMNPGFRVSYEITAITGITNRMLKDAPPCEQVMRRFAAFIGASPLVAHNASFDRRFLSAELTRVDHHTVGPFACSMLIARRLFQRAPNHKLGTLVAYRDLPNDGTFHRALADSQMTAHLWLDLVRQLQDRFQIARPSFSLMKRVEKTAKSRVNELLRSQKK